MAHYLWNHYEPPARREDLRARSSRPGLRRRRVVRPFLEIVKIVRDEIDARMITANHCGQRREDRLKETYQRKLSDVYGAIHAKQFFDGFAGGVAPEFRIGVQAKCVARPSFVGRGAFTDEKICSLSSGAWTPGSTRTYRPCALAATERGPCCHVRNARSQREIANIDHTFVVGGFKCPTW